MVSKEKKTQSQEEHGAPNTDSVYDYLYYDAERIASFMSQFDEAGNLTGIVLKESVEDSQSTGGNVELGAGMPAMASGKLNSGTTVVSGTRDEGQRVYDPTWTNARTFLDYLSGRSMIQRSVSKAHMGQFVLCSGSLSVIDLQLMNEVWKLPTIQSLIQSGADSASTPGNRHQRRSQRKLPPSEPPAEVTMVLELLSVLPHTIQAKITGAESVWCVLSQEGMSTLASDISLKHGTEIPGKWHALGILDAKPFETVEAEQEQDFEDGQEMAAKMMAALAPLTRTILGRPEDHYGITPLLIFRDVSPTL